MSLLGFPKFRRLLDAVHEDRQRGVLGFVGREGSAQLDLELSKPSPRARTPREPVFEDGASRPSFVEQMLGARGRERDRDGERER